MLFPHFLYFLEETFFCRKCAKIVASELLYHYRKSIPADKLPPARPGLFFFFFFFFFFILFLLFWNVC